MELSIFGIEQEFEGEGGAGEYCHSAFAEEARVYEGKFCDRVTDVQWKRIIGVGPIGHQAGQNPEDKDDKV